MHMSMFATLLLTRHVSLSHFIISKLGTPTVHLRSQNIVSKFVKIELNVKTREGVVEINWGSAMLEEMMYKQVL